ncbi:cell envelope integrity protein TolA [Marinoscillum sp.]|uniref:cell envelope integrity protein TolA n=1 Tax=Marinoscillum sp. TaxID=2024838 RepID=UPI003BA899A4
MHTLQLSKENEAKVMVDLNKRSDQFIFRFLSIYSVFGIFISFYYDTWLIGLSTAALAMASWFVLKALLPNASLHRYVASGFFGVFVGTFIYQMHGLFEMHFFAFIGSAILIVYQDWKYQIPLITFVVVHHAVFAFLQYTGVPDIYFTQLEYMDLQTFIYHASLALAVVIVCGYWAHHFRELTMSNAIQSIELKKKVKMTAQLNKQLNEASAKLKTKNAELEDNKAKLLSLTEKQAAMYQKLREDAETKKAF